MTRHHPLCRDVTLDVDGEPAAVRIRSVGEPTPDDLATLAEFVRFLRRRATAEVVELPPSPDVGRDGLALGEGRWT